MTDVVGLGSTSSNQLVVSRRYTADRDLPALTGYAAVVLASMVGGVVGVRVVLPVASGVARSRRVVQSGTRHTRCSPVLVTLSAVLDQNQEVKIGR